MHNCPRLNLVSPLQNKGTKEQFDIEKATKRMEPTFRWSEILLRGKDVSEWAWEKIGKKSDQL